MHFPVGTKFCPTNGYAGMGRSINSAGVHMNCNDPIRNALQMTFECLRNYLHIAFQKEQLKSVAF